MHRLKTAIRKHVETNKERIVQHVQRHHKKYLLISGAAFGIIIMQIVIITVMFLEVSMITQRSNTAMATDQWTQTYHALTLFYQLDDIAHQVNNRIMKSGNPDLMTGESTFLQLDANFHAIPMSNINEKFKAAKKLEIFLKEQDKLLHKLGNTNDLDPLFHSIIEIFDQIE